MKEITSLEEYFDILENDEPIIVEFGTPNGCNPCEVAKHFLETLEEKNILTSKYYLCRNIDVMTDLDINQIPYIYYSNKKGIKGFIQDREIIEDGNKLLNNLKGMK